MINLEQLQQLDRQITLAINSCYSPITDPIWMFFSNKYVWFPFYAAIAVFMVIRFGWKRSIFAIVSMALMVTACDQLGNVVKDTVCRLRPSHDEWMLNHGLHLLEGAGNMYGFYSAHAANSVGFAVGSLTCFKLYDKLHKYTLYGWIACIWSILVGLSRIFVGKHFLGDVLAGSMVGVVIGWLMAFIFYKLACRFTWTAKRGSLMSSRP